MVVGTRSETMNIENALKIHGFTNEHELRWLAEQASKCKGNIAEIGCWKGRSTRAMADNTEAIVYAVDTWRGTAQDPHFKELIGKPEEYLMEIFLENMGDHCSEPHWHVRPCPHEDASTYFAKYLGGGCYNRKFDMVFIDAAHDYASVRADILAWKPLLVPGGLMCGHDFETDRGGVVKAVKEIYPKARKVGVGTIWITGE